MKSNLCSELWSMRVPLTWDMMWNFIGRGMLHVRLKYHISLAWYCVVGLCAWQRMSCMSSLHLLPGRCRTPDWQQFINLLHLLSEFVEFHWQSDAPCWNKIWRFTCLILCRRLVCMTTSCHGVTTSHMHPVAVADSCSYIKTCPLFSFSGLFL